jgi:hypothetical protein
VYVDTASSPLEIAKRLKSVERALAAKEDHLRRAGPQQAGGGAGTRRRSGAGPRQAGGGAGHGCQGGCHLGVVPWQTGCGAGAGFSAEEGRRAGMPIVQRDCHRRRLRRCPPPQKPCSQSRPGPAGEKLQVCHRDRS